MKSLRLLFCAAILMAVAGASPSRAEESEFMEYDVTWIGVSVATMEIRSATNEAGHLVRSLRIWNRPWIAMVYPVSTFVECETETSDQGPRRTIRKKVSEPGFAQDDVLVLWPNQGRAFWQIAGHRGRKSLVPVGSRDLVTFFFDLRDVLAGSPLAAGGNYQLVMDGAIHDLEIEIGQPKTIRTAFGRLEAIPVAAVSKSPTLFSRNRPKSVWVATAKPAVLCADVETRFGPVRATLVKWTLNGAPVSPGSGSAAR